ncbi:MAG: c-type cytochrome [Arcicella sp.]|jgi:cytochrome c peroxidase|nr:c-type cytochrome [Arcicella sp.]
MKSKFKKMRKGITFLKSEVAYFFYAIGLVITLISMTVDEGKKFKKDELPQSTVELGKKLFFDPILSSTYKVSCGSCHKPEYGFADNTAFSMGVDSNFTGRNTPTVTYLATRLFYFWDGRAESLEKQALGPITHPKEMNLPIVKAIERLRASPYYVASFKSLFYEAPNARNLTKSIADYQRSLEKFNTPFDNFMRGDLKALNEKELHGLEVYLSGNCKNCHGRVGILAKDDYANIGLYQNENDDKGLFELTKDSLDLGKFKIPHLRNLPKTAPYMHDGSKKTLREVVEFYNQPELFNKGKNVDVRMKGQYKMTENDIDDLVIFLTSLSDK